MPHTPSFHAGRVVLSPARCWAAWSCLRWYGQVCTCFYICYRVYISSPLWTLRCWCGDCDPLRLYVACMFVLSSFSYTVAWLNGVLFSDFTVWIGSTSLGSWVNLLRCPPPPSVPLAG
ncbi:hypothetical protein F5141DRAFT_515156 [Pisolithus sp. B1]|nr:hypothetical protein F5141DRAFT_515156 [Pisolithus sp. B1]